MNLWPDATKRSFHTVTTFLIRIITLWLRQHVAPISNNNNKQKTNNKTKNGYKFTKKKKKFPLVYRCLKWKNNEVICKFRWVELTRLEVEFLQKEKKLKKPIRPKKKKKEEEYGLTTDGVADVSQIKAQLLQFRFTN